jgi:hypothetical protein
MSVIATEQGRLSNLVKMLDSSNNPELHNEVVTVNEAAPVTYKLGTVLGKITASGKYIVAKETAVDGSKVPAAIFIGDAQGLCQDTAIVATTDTKVLTIARGKAVLSLSACLFDATYSDATKLGIAYAALKANGILLENTI